MPSDNNYSGPKYPADRPRGYAKIENAALSARAILGFSSTEPLPGEPLLWRFKETQIEIDGELYPLAWDVFERLPEDELARTSFQPGEGFVVALSEETYDHLSSGRYPCSKHCRARFSLYHEVAHIMLHAVEVKRLGEIPSLGSALQRASYQTLKPWQDAEWQANAFSAAMQCPALGLQQLSRQGPLTGQAVRDHYRLSWTTGARCLKKYNDRREELLQASRKAKTLGR